MDNSVYGQIDINEIIKQRLTGESVLDEENEEKKIISPRDIQESNLTKTYTDINLKIKIPYPNYWKKFDMNAPVFEKAICAQILCFVSFDLLNDGKKTNTIFGAILHDDWILKGCDCKNLTDSIKWYYEYLRNFPGFSFIDDSQITMKNNVSAWRMEYLSGPVYVQSVITIFNERVFEFVLEAPNQNYYNLPYYHIKFMKDFKKVVNSIEFLPSITPIKQPSFLK